MAKKILPSIRPAHGGSAQRLNLGLTLLALIFLTVLAAAAGVRGSRSGAAVHPQGEPLAVLGVTPGANGDTPDTRAADPSHHAH